MTEPAVTTSTMKPAIPSKNGGSNGSPPIATNVVSSAQPPAQTPPKPRRARRKKKDKPPAKIEPTSEQFEALGILAYEARQRSLTLDEYVAELRSTVEAYDAIFGV